MPKSALSVIIDGKKNFKSNIVGFHWFLCLYLENLIKIVLLIIVLSPPAGITTVTLLFTWY